MGCGPSLLHDEQGPCRGADHSCDQDSVWREDTTPCIYRYNFEPKPLQKASRIDPKLHLLYQRKEREDVHCGPLQSGVPLHSSESMDRARRPISAQDPHRGGAVSSVLAEELSHVSYMPCSDASSKQYDNCEGLHTASTTTPKSSAKESISGGISEDNCLPESRLKVYSNLFEEVIERDKVYGSLLRKVKTAYDSFLRPQERRVMYSIQPEAVASGGAGPITM